MRVFNKHSAPFMFFYLALLAGANTAGANDSRRADIRGGGGDQGKCTIEVEVDGVADVEIRGDQARVRTLSGQPAFFRRFVCNQPMPRAMSEFRFRGIDGRGRQELVRDPRSSGVAVVRIADRDNGREGYTFDLEWRGGYSGAGRYNYWDGRDFDRDGSSVWNGEVRFRGRGDGYYRSSPGPDDRLEDCQVTISRNGDVDVVFEASRNYRLALQGRIIRMDRDRVYARMTGQGLYGEMLIRLDDRQRVKEIRMDGSGRTRFELRWRD